MAQAARAWGRLIAVQISARADYAVRAAVALAVAYPRTVSAQALAAEQELPRKFLETILADLRRTGLVQSTRGVDGGYALSRPPAEIHVGDVLRAVHGTVFDTPALSDPACPPELRRAWLRTTLAGSACSHRCHSPTSMGAFAKSSTPSIR